MELTLLQETSITLTELDGMDKKRKWLYFYYIVARSNKERREMEDKANEKGNGRNTTSIDFPEDFISVIDAKIDSGELERGS